MTDLGDIAFSPGAEDWIEFGPAGARQRVGFHDYSALYAVPGLYERVFYHQLGMCSSRRVVDLYAGVLGQLERPPDAECALDLGAGNGLGGQELRRIGVGRLFGVDLEPQAREAAFRDRPGVYDEYFVGDFAGLPQAKMAALELTAVLALSALGPGHAPPAVLDHALRLLPRGGLFGFAITPTLLAGSDDPTGHATGYPEYLVELFADHSHATTTCIASGPTAPTTQRSRSSDGFADLSLRSFPRPGAGVAACRTEPERRPDPRSMIHSRAGLAATPLPDRSVRIAEHRGLWI